MWLPFLGILAGLVLLTYASDQFVAGAARLAVRLRLSTVVIGAVVIGFGTSAPEMVVSGLAAAQGSLDIAVGNIVGSNIANLSLVLGVSALIVPIAVSRATLRREAPISLAAAVLFAVLVQGGFTLVEAAVAAVAMVASLAWILLNAREEEPEISEEIEEVVGDTATISTGLELLRTAAGLAGTLVAAQVLVWSATTIAAGFGLGEGFVGMTLIAIGTSLPELATSVQAARKGETDLIIGNLLGSNVFNSLAVTAVAGAAGAGPLADPEIAGTAVILMLAVAVVATLFMLTRRTVVRWEAAVLLGVYVVAVPLLA